MSRDHQTKKHIPVLLSQVLNLVGPKQGETLLDVTAGYGGHASAILERTLQDSGSVLVDRDGEAVEDLQATFKGRAVQIVQASFLEASQTLSKAGQQFDIIVADLGVSSPHLDNINRGFSFKNDGPLDMRMDSNQALTAATIVNEYSQDELIRILKDYGEEHKARRIAEGIVAARPITSTTELASVVERAVRAKWQKAHPATKTFQALRIAVNDELGQLEAALPLWLKLLRPGGRLAVISFHSLEDRIVKKFLADKGGARYDAELNILTKKPIKADREELVFNPRARSASLRGAVKIKTKGVPTYANPGKK